MVNAPRLTAALLVAATSLALAASPATAHTELTSTSPKAGTYAKRSLSVVRARFNQPIRSGRLQVLRAGKKVSQGTGRRSPDNVRTIEARIPEELAGGVYVARWTMTAVDGHVQRGSWRFKVRPKPAATPAPAATTQASPTIEPSPSAEPTATVDPASASDDGGAGDRGAGRRPGGRRHSWPPPAPSLCCGGAAPRDHARSDRPRGGTGDRLEHELAVDRGGVQAVHVADVEPCAAIEGIRAGATREPVVVVAAVERVVARAAGEPVLPGRGRRACRRPRRR